MSIVTAILILCAIGILCALMLVFAAKYMSVPVDEKFPAIRGCLPGANCGACGYAGCDGYATALAAGDEDKTNKCVAGGADVAKALAEACGVEFEAVASVNACVHCQGDCNATTKKANFVGAKTCVAAKLLFSGDGACAYGCLGYGDCAAICPEHAINIINGVAHVNAARCTGCGMCAKTCPNKIISVIPSAAGAKVLCSNHDKGAVTKKKCAAGCLGCGMCMRKCPNQAITLANNLAVIDYEKCTGCGTCKEVCPAKCIID